MPPFFRQPCRSLPSPGLEFDTFDDCIKHCKEYATANGYELSIYKKYPSAKQFTRVTLRYGKGRKYERDRRYEETHETKGRAGKT